jgi:hypothetical protein
MIVRDVFGLTLNAKITLDQESSRLKFQNLMNINSRNISTIGGVSREPLVSATV